MVWGGWSLLPWFYCSRPFLLTEHFFMVEYQTFARSSINIDSFPTFGTRNHNFYILSFWEVGDKTSASVGFTVKFHRVLRPFVKWLLLSSSILFIISHFQKIYNIFLFYFYPSFTYCSFPPFHFFNYHKDFYKDYFTQKFFYHFKTRESKSYFPGWVQ